MKFDARPSPMLLSGGTIYPRAGQTRTASGLILANGRVEALVEEGAVAEAVGERVDLNGLVVLPGFTDAHIHLEKYSRQAQWVDCETTTLAECLGRVGERVKEVRPGLWVLGHGWNQNEWERFGTAADLDTIAPDNPVYLTAKSLHAGWANSLALQMAGLSDSTSNPPGGALQRDAQGQLTGILFENALSFVADILPTPTLASTIDNLRAAQSRLWRMGITSVHDFDGPRCFQALQALRENGELGLRVLKSIPHELLSEAVALGLRSGFGDEWLRLGHVKLFADGALGPRTAAMLAPYEGDEGGLGILLLDREAVLETGIRAADAGLGLAVHAIGDRANHEVLEGMAALRRYESEHRLPHRRHRIEHLQLLHPDDLRRPAELGVVASMQPFHATSDMLMADRHWGSRVRTAYAWQSQVRAGATLAFGSDAPVESPSPLLGLHAAVSRRRLDGSPSVQGWTAHERLVVGEAVRAYTEGPAYAAGQEGSQGRLEAGYTADLIVLDRDPQQCSPEDLPGVRVLGAMVAGHWAFRDF